MEYSLLAGLFLAFTGPPLIAWISRDTTTLPQQRLLVSFLLAQLALVVNLAVVLLIAVLWEQQSFRSAGLRPPDERSLVLELGRAALLVWVYAPLATRLVRCLGFLVVRTALWYSGRYPVSASCLPS
jgi:hypothetical protein